MYFRAELKPASGAHLSFGRRDETGRRPSTNCDINYTLFKFLTEVINLKFPQSSKHCHYILCEVYKST